MIEKKRERDVDREEGGGEKKRERKRHGSRLVFAKHQYLRPPCWYLCEVQPDSTRLVCRSNYNHSRLYLSLSLSLSLDVLFCMTQKCDNFNYYRANFHYRFFNRIYFLSFTLSVVSFSFYLLPIQLSTFFYSRGTFIFP